MADLNSMEFKADVDLENNRNMMALGVIKRRMTREERLKAKEREEALKGSGESSELSSHVPKFIADAPWYMADDSGGSASLKHQR